MTQSTHLDQGGHEEGWRIQKPYDLRAYVENQLIIAKFRRKPTWSIFSAIGSIESVRIRVAIKD
jgi:hypothetical protein